MPDSKFFLGTLVVDNPACDIPHIEEELTVAVLMEYVVPGASEKWQMVAVELGLEHGQIQAIEQQYRGDPNLCYLAIFSHWKDHLEIPFIWSTILTILKSPLVNKQSLAKLIIKKLTKNTQ